MNALDFLLDTSPLPAPVMDQARRCLMDLIGIGWGGSTLPLSAIIRDHAAKDLTGAVPLPFDQRSASPIGVALATGMTIDALDGHDGFNPSKGHCGCGLLAGLIAVAPDDMDDTVFLDLLGRGYELASRLAITHHATCPDYQTSGAWVAVAVAGLAGRILRLTPDQITHAMGIADYHGPRSPMMRCIDHPTMLKDGSGVGAMVGVQAAQLAARGFTGAPALSLNGPAWDDLGQTWLIHDQYFKPYPVCRWAHPPVEAVLSLRDQLDPAAITAIEVETFHESTRLATFAPKTSEEAQYSTAFPVAVALARGRITPGDLTGAALHDPLIRKLAACLTFRENDHANAVFPGQRLARATIIANGREHVSDWFEPRWEGTAPPTSDELRAKFLETSGAALSEERQHDLLTMLWGTFTVAGLRKHLRP